MEFFSIHLYYTCHDGSKGSDEWQKPGTNNSKPTMFLIKFMCLMQVFFLKKKPVFPIVHSRADFSACPVANGISCNTYNRNNTNQHKQINKFVLHITHANQF